MKITEKLNLEFEGLLEHGPINIVVFGDSVTHGALGSGEIDYETVYWNRLRKKINALRNYMPVNVINAGIGGISAKGSLDRMQAHVLDHHPDLIIVCFGLNDVNFPLNEYLDPMREIFERSLNSGAEVIFLTPNMFNTYVADDTAEFLKDYAAVTADMQNNGKMDHYIESAMALAHEMGVQVCDCYSKWKELSKTQDVTMLLSNRINHPTREMHELFAEELFQMICGDYKAPEHADSNTMYSEDK
ncbi:MAG: GDSL family lipase [Ruminococcaceae bacterium]|nr:GDSL family lipase [Oscillospiraceae bacterium]